MGFLQIALQGNIKKFTNNLKLRAKQENRSYFGMLCGFTRDFLLYQCSFSDYLDYGFYNMKHAEKKEYVTTRVADTFYTTVNPDKYKTYFTIKPNFLKNFAQYCPRDWFCPDAELSRDENIRRLTEFFSGKEYYMEKPLDGLAGQEVHKRAVADVGDIGEYYDKLVEKRLFVDELIKQHEAINELNASSVNTIRIITFAAGDKSRIVYAFIRVGRGNSEVDNFHQGGMSARVDLETGRLDSDAVDKQNNWYEYHPVNGTKFKGHQIPHWDCVRKTVLAAALQNQKIHVVGWDVAITPDGCTFVEGNRRAGFASMQCLSKRGRKDLLREMYAELSAVDGKKYKI